MSSLWYCSGGGDIVALSDSIAGLAPKFLPKRVSRVLTARVELAPAGQILRGIKNKDEAIVREIKSDDLSGIEPASALPN